MGVSESEIIYLAPKRSSVLKEALKRIVMVIISPFSTYDDIGVSPEMLGPLILVLLQVLFAVLFKYLLYLHIGIVRLNFEKVTEPKINVINDTLYVCYNTNLTLPPKATVSSSLNLFINYISWLILFSFLAVGIRWLIIGLVVYFLIILFKGETRGIASGTGYLLSVSLVQLIITGLLQNYYPKNINSVIVVLPAKANVLRDAILVNRALLEWFARSVYLLKYLSLINWFMMLWQGVLMVALFMGIAKLSGTKSIIAAIIAIIASSLILSPITGLLAPYV